MNGGIFISDYGTIDVEKKYSDFLDSNSAEVLFDGFSHAIREAFFAGYKAAGGDVTSPTRRDSKITLSTTNFNEK